MGTREVQIINGYKGFNGGKRQVLSGIDLEIERCEFLAVLGARGSGKFTLLRVLARLHSFDSVPCSGTRRGRAPSRTGVVFQ